MSTAAPAPASPQRILLGNGHLVIVDLFPEIILVRVKDPSGRPVHPETLDVLDEKVDDKVIIEDTADFARILGALSALPASVS